jgi:hypothetical protein
MDPVAVEYIEHPDWIFHRMLSHGIQNGSYFSVCDLSFHVFTFLWRVEKRIGAQCPCSSSVLTVLE